ncbi:MAG TPA: alkaline phosphatase, partial [Burkholderiaceae bacterium]
MSEHTVISRRHALKLFAALPMLPLAAGSADTHAAKIAAARFAGASFGAMPAPNTPAAMATTTVASSLQVKLSNGKTLAYQLAYQPFFMTGDELPDGKGGRILAGGCYDIHQKPIID